MSRRTEQLSANIIRICAAKLAELPVPGVLLTVTRAKVAPDNRRASVWVAGWEYLSEVVKSDFIREMQSELARQSTSKFTPHLEIMVDDSAVQAAAIVNLVKSSVDQDHINKK